MDVVGEDSIYQLKSSFVTRFYVCSEYVKACWLRLIGCCDAGIVCFYTVVIMTEITWFNVELVNADCSSLRNNSYSYTMKGGAVVENA